MKTLRNKTAVIAIVILLTISMSASIMLVPNISAHTPPLQIPTYAFISVTPNPAGLAQTLTVGFWLQVPPPTAQAQFGDRWTGFSLKITKPDGTTETLGPFTSDDTGGTFTTYSPTILGNYTFEFSFPGQTLAGNNLAPGVTTNPFIGDYYQPSSAKTTITVQEEPIPLIPENPLPTQYWTRPIQSVNNLWSTLGGAWLGLGSTSFANTGAYNATSNYNPFTTSPKTPHIIWARPTAPGGQIGGEFGGTSQTQFYAPAQYEPKFAPIIMNGILYYTIYPGAITNPTGWAAVNLKTGQTLWIKNMTVGSTLGPILRCGQTLYYISPNQYGGFTYLWSTGNPFGTPTLTGNILTVPAKLQTTLNPGTYAPVTTALTGTTYSMWDAVSGEYILSIVNCTALTLAEDERGNLIGYYVNSSTANAYNKPTLNMWNSTRAILLNQPAQYYGQTSANAWYWRPPANGIIPFADGIQWTAPIATDIAGATFHQTFTNNVLVNSSLSIAGNCVGQSGVVLMFDSSGIAGSFQQGYQIEAGYSAIDGHQLWITNRTMTSFTRVATLAATNGVYGELNYATAEAYGFNIVTGAQVWGPVKLPNANPYTSIGGYQHVSANGVCYVWGFGGEIYAINMANGALLWSTSTNEVIGDPGVNTPYGVWPLWTFNVGSVADGLLFVPVGHQYSPPLFRGAKQLAINTTDGTLVWSVMGFDVTTATAVSDGVMTAFSSYDNRIYAYSKGPSAMTVIAPDVGVTTATPITIRGAVMDISAGTKQEEQAANFPNGVPCVSDASQAGWMEYVYMQQQCPTNVTGVPVSIYVIDNNNNYRQIGSTTSDASGMFTFNWTPDIAGSYTVVAIFAGSESYYTSSAETSFYASETTSATVTPTTTQQSAADMYFVPAIAGLFVLIIIVLAVVVLGTLRKRP
jgi:hypothetical protein